jgi:hypothetical protein
VWTAKGTCVAHAPISQMVAVPSHPPPHPPYPDPGLRERAFGACAVRVLCSMRATEF